MQWSTRAVLTNHHVCRGPARRQHHAQHQLLDLPPQEELAEVRLRSSSFLSPLLTHSLSPSASSRSTSRAPWERRAFVPFAAFEAMLTSLLQQPPHLLSAQPSPGIERPQPPSKLIFKPCPARDTNTRPLHCGSGAWEPMFMDSRGISHLSFLPPLPPQTQKPCNHHERMGTSWARLEFSESSEQRDRSNKVVVE